MVAFVYLKNRKDSSLTETIELMIRRSFFVTYKEHVFQLRVEKPIDDVIKHLERSLANFIQNY